jgi:N-acetyl-gamma-glutamyl-phosphate reductase
MHQPLVFIDGDQGTTGLLIHSRLQGRDNLRLLTLPDSERKDPKRRAEAINSVDVAILCLPDDAARQAVATINSAKVRVIDASSAHRTAPGWVYGLPELDEQQAERIAQAQRVSNPGCYPTGAIALLRPLLSAGLVPAAYPLTVNAVSGYSGGGRAAVERYESAEQKADQGVLVYGLNLDHKHVPEIQVHAGLSHRPVFIPSYGSYRQGIALTIALQTRLLPAGVNATHLHERLRQYYHGSRYVHVAALEQGEAAPMLDPQTVNDSNELQLAVFANPAHGQIVLTAVFDNLGKGASGAAVQNLELMLASI